MREVIDRARSNPLFRTKGSPILFIDEIHRFNKAQQDSLLGAVERGDITLIGATTEVETLLDGAVTVGAVNAGLGRGTLL